jgi:hypothetical protein
MLQGLPKELLTHIFTFNVLEEIVSLSQTNHFFKHFTKSSIFWSEFVGKDSNFEDYQQQIYQKSLNFFQVYVVGPTPQNNFFAFCPFLQQSTLTNYSSKLSAEKGMLKNIDFLTSKMDRPFLEELPVLHKCGKFERVQECWFNEGKSSSDELLLTYLIQPLFNLNNLYIYCPKFHFFVKSSNMEMLIQETEIKLNNVTRSNYKYEFFDKANDVKCTDVHNYVTQTILSKKSGEFIFEPIENSKQKRFDFWFPNLKNRIV